MPTDSAGWAQSRYATTPDSRKLLRSQEHVKEKASTTRFNLGLLLNID
jgi:hypothetical protein